MNAQHRGLLGQMVAPIEGRVRLMIGRAILRLVDDARQMQELQVDLLEGEAQDGVERFQNYGFSSVPHPGAEAVVACVGGLRSHMIALAVDDRRYRLSGLESGEVALYDDLGNVIRLGRDAISVIAVSRVEVTAPDGVTIAGDVTVAGDVVADGISLKAHVHGGVQAGAAQTGAPA